MLEQDRNSYSLHQSPAALEVIYKQTPSTPCVPRISIAMNNGGVITSGSLDNELEKTLFYAK